MKKNSKRKNGFTLIELIVVIAILAILAAVAVPNYIGLSRKAQIATEVAAASEFANAINITNTLTPGTITAMPTDTTTLGTFKTALGALLPVTEFTDAKLLSNVLVRITIVSGVAQVTDKDELG